MTSMLKAIRYGDWLHVTHPRGIHIFHVANVVDVEITTRGSDPTPNSVPIYQLRVHTQRADRDMIFETASVDEYKGFLANLYMDDD